MMDNVVIFVNEFFVIEVICFYKCVVIMLDYIVFIGR